MVHIHLVDQWVILTSNQFDLQIPDLPPFQTLSILYNCQTRDFVCRGLGRSLERGSFQSLEQLAKFAQKIFLNKVACIGSGDFPASLIYSQSCVGYAPSSPPSSTSSTDHKDLKLALTHLRCESCQTNRESGTKDIDHEVANNAKDPLESSGSTNDAFDTFKTEIEEDIESMEVQETEEDEHGGDPISIFHPMDELDVTTKKVGRPCKANKQLGSQSSEHSSYSKRRIKIIYPKNLQRKPRADGKFACEHCEFVSGTSEGKTRHKQLHHGWGSFKCELCPTAFKEAVDYIHHMAQTHMGVFEAKCPLCQERVHFEGETEIFVGHYSTCVRLRHEVFLAKRVEVDRARRAKPIQCTCDICGRLFTSLTSLKVHQRVHNGKGSACPECDFVASSVSLLASHRETHERERGTAMEFICPTCGHCSRGKHQFNNHLSRCNRPYQCPHCPEVCLGYTVLSRHKSEVHGANRCEVCGMCFTTKHLLQRHKPTHSEPSLSCRFCTRLFKTDRCLTNHERTHTGESPFECQVCGARFKTPAARSLHKKSKHNEGKHLRKQCNEELDD